MQTEYEVKFTNVDIESTRSKLRQLGGVCDMPMRLMRRVTIDTPDMKQKNAFLRVRDEGHRVTMTYKQFDTLSVDGAKEHEVVVSDFDEAINLLAAAGLPHGSFQESKRETWHLDGAEVVIDEWPWLRPYIEIEGSDEAHVKHVAEMLECEWDTAVFGDVMAAYRIQYPHLTERQTIGNLPEVRFGAPLPDLLKP